MASHCVSDLQRGGAVGLSASVRREIDERKRQPHPGRACCDRRAAARSGGAAAPAQAWNPERHVDQHVKHDRHRAVHHCADHPWNDGRAAGSAGGFAGAILAIADGLVISELGAALPGSGGTYVFLRDSYNRESWGKLMAWLFAWEFMFFGPLEIASGTVGMTQYMSYLWTGLARHPWEMKLVAASIAVIVMISLYRRI